jgi:hypothetical protein
MVRLKSDMWTQSFHQGYSGWPVPRTGAFVLKM